MNPSSSDARDSRDAIRECVKDRSVDSASCKEWDDGSGGRKEDRRHAGGVAAAFRPENRNGWDSQGLLLIQPFSLPVSSIVASGFPAVPLLIVILSAW